MKRSQSGFTLIELIIVIVILGILAVTAAPKFLDFGGDARNSVLQGVKGSLESAGSLVYGKAIIESKHTQASGENLNAPLDGVALVYGYPAATAGSLQAAAELADFTLGADTDENASNADTASVRIGSDAQAIADGGCYVYYIAASAAGAKPYINIVNDGC